MSARAKHTIEDYRKLPEGAPYELIGGNLIMVPAPNWKHQRLSRKLEHALITHIEHEKAGEIFDAPVDVYFDDENILQPDIVFIAKGREGMLGDKWYIQGAPDLVVKILSPSNSSVDAIEKKDIYERFGVREYWIVDPMLQSVYIHTLNNGAYRLVKKYTRETNAVSIILPGFEIALAALFEETPA